MHIILKHMTCFFLILKHMTLIQTYFLSPYNLRGANNTQTQYAQIPSHRPPSFSIFLPPSQPLSILLGNVSKMALDLFLHPPCHSSPYSRSVLMNASAWAYTEHKESKRETRREKERGVCAFVHCNKECKENQWRSDATLIPSRAQNRERARARERERESERERQRT